MAPLSSLQCATRRRLSHSAICVLHSWKAAVWCAVIAAGVVGVGVNANAVGINVDDGWGHPRVDMTKQAATDAPSGAEDRAFLVSLVVREHCGHLRFLQHTHNEMS